MKKENPRAFPSKRKEIEINRHGYSNTVEVEHGGMTLLDYFASHVLLRVFVDVSDYSNTAKMCYDMAEAMLAERQKR